MTVAAVSQSNAQSELAKYQQKLADDLAAKASAKVAARQIDQDHDRAVTEDRADVTKAQQEVQREQEAARTRSTSGYQSRLDVTA